MGARGERSLMYNRDGRNIMTRDQRLARVENTLASLIDICLSMRAMLEEKGYCTTEEFNRMLAATGDARRRLGNAFTVDEGLRVIRAGFRITLPPSSPGP